MTATERRALGPLSGDEARYIIRERDRITREKSRGRLKGAPFDYHLKRPGWWPPRVDPNVIANA